MEAWIEWNGGRCPVNVNVWVEVMFGDMKKSIFPAKAFSWSHGDFTDLNIIAYRIVK